MMGDSIHRDLAEWAQRRIRELEAERDALREDAERIDYLEQIIRDGSYQTIINDIAAVCHAAYKAFGPGPALRTSIDTQRPHPAHPGRNEADAAIDAARKEKL